MSTNTAFLASTMQVVDENGYLTMPWLQFFIALYNRTGGTIPVPPMPGDTQNVFLSTGGDDGAASSRTLDRALLGILAQPVDQSASVRRDGRLQSMVQPQDASNPNEAVRRSTILSQMLPHNLPFGDSARSYKILPISPGAGPNFYYRAPSNGMVIISGGTVGGVFYTRDNGLNIYAVGITSGIVPLRKADQVGVSFSAAPTMNFVPM